ncbi:MAG: tol-pal system protein YbgF, partial [bacterium]
SARKGLAVTLSLLAVVLFSRCGLQREFVRRGALLDSIAFRVERIEQEQASQREALNRFRADFLTGLEKVERRLGEVDAQLTDLGEQLNRIGRKVGAWRGELTAETQSREDSVPIFVPDTVNLGIDADRLYNTAYLDFTKGNYQVAIVGFRRFIKLFPSSDMADNARYWIGECFYSQGQIDSAETEFQQLITEYPQGNKMPAAIYKLGLVYQLQGKEELAQKRFKEVVERYPGTPESNLAKERLKILDK